MSQAFAKNRFGDMGAPIFIVFAVFQVLGLFAYFSRNVLTPAWLWDNQDYMLFLNASYYHLHMVCVIGHLFGWGLYLLWKQFHQKWWSLYWTSFAMAFVLTAIPLLRVQRVHDIYGAAAFAAFVAFYALLFAFYVYHLIRRRPRFEIAAFHVFSGYPLAALFFQSRSVSSNVPALALWTLLLLHVALVWQIIRSNRGEAALAATSSAASRPVYLGHAIILLLAALACLPHHYIQLLYSRTVLRNTLEHVGYAQAPIAPPLADMTPPPNHLRFRTYDGSWNNLKHPEIGMANTPLGRYIPESGRAPQDVNAEPSVLRISERLLKQEQFLSAAPLNALAMAWVNFFVHDFFDRGVGDNLIRPATENYKIPVSAGRFMYMSKLMATPEGAHTSRVTHWFDASQIYGSNAAKAQALRAHAGGKMTIEANGLLPATPQGFFLTGDAPRSSLHLGVLMLHHLWVAEHNYLAAQLQQRYPAMADEELYQTARLIVAAEIVKIHTVEWTAQLVADPVSAEFMARFWEQFGKAEYREDLYYSVSEEFISSYVLHEIMPPAFSLVDAQGNELESVRFVTDLFYKGGQERLKKHGLANVLSSFGVNPMGVIYPFNVPEEIRRFSAHEMLIPSEQRQPDDAGYLDLGAIPIARERDARIPKYNDLRERLGMPRLKSIREVTNDPAVVKALEELYGDVDQIEYLVGFKAESRPSNWGLTYTQVLAFLPVVVYRIIADRFYTRDFTAEVYTPYGIERLRDVRFYDIIKNLYGPSLLPSDRNTPIFHLWKK